LAQFLRVGNLLFFLAENHSAITCVKGAWVPRAGLAVAVYLCGLDFFACFHECDRGGVEC